MELQELPDEPADPVAGGPPDSADPTGLVGPDVPGVTPEVGEPGEPAGVDVVRRRRPSTVGGAVYLCVLAASGAGLAIVSRGDWRLGVKWIAASLLVAAAVRLALPAREAGMLAVRRRFIDVGLLAAVGFALWFLSVSIPNQPLP